MDIYNKLFHINYYPTTWEVEIASASQLTYCGNYITQLKLEITIPNENVQNEVTAEPRLLDKYWLSGDYRLRWAHFAKEANSFLLYAIQYHCSLIS